jgi:hypothetical protein
MSPTNGSGSASPSGAAGKITNFVVAVTALVGALGGYERVGSFMCTAWAGFPWCENTITFSSAQF